MEMEEIVKLVIVVIVLILAIGGVIILVQGKGGAILSSIKDFMGFGG